MSALAVLLVEDNLLNRRLVRDLLEHHGHRVVEACTVEEAWAALQAETFDIGLLDVQIPGGGGTRLVERIRATPLLARLPLVAVTAFAMDGDREHLLAQGFDGYVSKPIDTRTFVALVASFARNQGVPR